MGLPLLLPLVALTFAPHAVYYKATGLGDYGVFPTIGAGCIAYLVTAMVKLGVLAALSEFAESGPALQLVLASMLSAVDTAGLWLGLARMSAKANVAHEHRFQGVALGWAFMDSLASRALPLSAVLRSPEAPTEHVLSGIQSNLMLLHMMSFAAVGSLLWLKRNKPVGMATVLQFWIVVHALLPHGVSLLHQLQVLDPIGLAGMQLGMGLLLAFAAYRLYLQASGPKPSSQ